MGSSVRRRWHPALGHAAAAVLAALWTAGAASATELDLTLFTHPSLIDHLPGPDGLIGTADDEVEPGANPGGSASRLAVSGTPLGDFGWALEGGLHIADLFEQGNRFVFTSVRGEGSSSFRFGLRRTGSDFALALVGTENGRRAAIVALPEDAATSPNPRFVNTNLFGRQELHATLGACVDTSQCALLDADLRIPAIASGPFLLRDLVETLTDATPTETLMRSLLPILPDDWSALAVLRVELGDVEPPAELAIEEADGVLVFIATDPVLRRDTRTLYGVVPDTGGIARGPDGALVAIEGEIRSAGELLQSPFAPIGGDPIGSFSLAAEGDADLRNTPGTVEIETPAGWLLATALRNNEVRRVDPASGRPLDALAPPDARCLTGHEAACLGPEWNLGGNADALAELCGPGLPSISDLLCGGTVFGLGPMSRSVVHQAVNRLLTGQSQNALILVALANPNFLPTFGAAQAGEALVSLVEDRPGEDIGPFGSLDRFLTPAQQALYGCGPWYRRSCFHEGPNLVHTEASALVQAWPSSGEPDAFDTSVQQPGTVGSVDGGACVRDIEGAPSLLPGCRGPLDPGYDPASDGSSTHPVIGPLRQPYTGQSFRSEVAATSWNAMVSIATTPRVGTPLLPADATFDPADPFRPGACSLRDPQRCLQLRGGLGGLVVRELEDDPSGLPHTRWLWETGAEYQIVEATGEFADLSSGFVHVFGPVESAVPDTSIGVPIMLVPPRDRDADGVLDRFDACPAVPDLQFDQDGDGTGDLCDNCPAVPNGSAIRDAGFRSQWDSDVDGFGNLCDADFNQDGFVGGPDFGTFLACLFRQVGPPSTLDLVPAGPVEDPLCAESDMNGDGYVGGPDFDRFLAAFDRPVGASRAQGCGLGFELVLLAALGWFRRRRSR